MMWSDWGGGIVSNDSENDFLMIHTSKNSPTETKTLHTVRGGGGGFKSNLNVKIQG